MAALAASQYGVVSRTQLTTVVGVSEAGVHRLVARGRLHPVYRGVYAVGHTALRREGRFIAAALASGPGTAVARRAAGAHWEIRPSDRAKVDVVTNRPGLAPHRQIDRRFSRHLGPQDVTVHRGVPVTTVTRTLVDLASVVGFHDLRRTLERADARQLLDAGAVLRSCAGRPGAPSLRAILESWAPAPTRSAFEDELLLLIQRAGFPPPRINSEVCGFEVDMFWPGERLVVEADSFAFHATRAAMERDRHRDAVLAREGSKNCIVIDFI